MPHFCRTGASPVARRCQLFGKLGAISRPERKDNPRPFFRFSRIVTKGEDDEYKKIIAAAKELASERPVVHGKPITDELYDLILFLTHSFLRPTTSEVFGLRYQDIVIADKPKRLVITVHRGKTGFRVVNTMEAGVSVYQRIRKRYPEHKPPDFIFLPTYRNRATVSTIFGRQFKEVVQRAKFEQDRYANQPHTLYSLRHTAICMRLILSEGKVNIFNLAKNAGTSVDQIERFYARNLPLSAEMARNLHTFGGSS